MAHPELESEPVRPPIVVGYIHLRAPPKSHCYSPDIFSTCISFRYLSGLCLLILVFSLDFFPIIALDSVFF